MRTLEERLNRRFKENSTTASREESQSSKQDETVTPDEPKNKKMKKSKVQPLEIEYPWGLEEEIKPETEARWKLCLESIDDDSQLRWQANQDDDSKWEKWLASVFMKNSKRMQNAQEELSEKSKEEMGQGKMPSNREDLKHVTATVRHYKLAWKQLMNCITIKLGRNIHMEDFVKFGTTELIEPTMLIKTIEEHISSIQVRHWCVLVHLAILRHQAKECLEQKEKFLPLVRNRESLTPVQIQQDCESEAEKKRSQIFNLISDIKLEQYSGFTAKQRKAQEKFNKVAREQYEGIHVPDPSVIIPDYLSHPRVQEIDRQICKAAEENTVVSAGTLVEFGEHLLRRLVFKNPHRLEVYNNVTRAEVLKGLSGSSVCFPYKPRISGEKQGDKAREEDIIDLDGIQCYWDDNANRDDLPQNERGACYGKVILVGNHKTADKYGPARLWVAPADDMFMWCYEKIVHTYAEFHGLQYDTECSFFVNSGTDDNKRLQPIMGQFCKSRGFMALLLDITGLPDLKPHDSRKMFATVLTASTSILIRDAAAVAASHSPGTQQATYITDRFRTMQAVSASAVYQDHVYSEGTATTFRVNLNQEKRLSETFKKIQARDKEKYLSKLAVRDRKKNASYERWLGDEEKYALLFLIIKHSEFCGNDWGFSYAEEFLTGKSIEDRTSRMRLLLLIDYSSSTDGVEVKSAANVLKKSMAAFAYHTNLQFDEEEADVDTIIHKTEDEYTRRLGNMLRMMSDRKKTSRIHNFRIKDMLTNFNEENSFKFVFNNPTLKKHLKEFSDLRKSQAENSLGNNSGVGLTPTEALDRMQAKAAKALKDASERKESKKRDQEDDPTSTSKGSTSMDQNFWIPPDVPEEEEVTQQIVFTPDKTKGNVLTIRDQDGANIDINMKGPVIVEQQKSTPSKRKKPKSRPKRANRPNWTDCMKVQLLGAWIEHSSELTFSKDFGYSGKRSAKDVRERALEKMKEESKIVCIKNDRSYTMMLGKITESNETLWEKLNKRGSGLSVDEESGMSLLERLDDFMDKKHGPSDDVLPWTHQMAKDGREELLNELYTEIGERPGDVDSGGEADSES